MFQIVATVVLSVALALGALFGVSKSDNLGAFTNIASTDRLTDFVATYNANLAKTIETGTTTVNSITSLPNLSTVGTITGGTWNASTLTVPYGGTGSTTLSSNQVLLGNGTGILKVVSGYGTSGQFLTSGGANVAPTWTTAAIDQAGNYAWTGTHSFSNTNTFQTATTSFTAGVSLTNSSLATSPLRINGIDYRFPASQGASSTILATNGSGLLSWSTLGDLNLGKATSTGSVTISNTTASDSDTHTFGFRPRLAIINIDALASGCTVNTGTKGQISYLDGPNKTEGQYYGWVIGNNSANAEEADPVLFSLFDTVGNDGFLIDTAGANLVDGTIEINNVGATGFDVVLTRTDTAGSGCSVTASYNITAIE